MSTGNRRWIDSYGKGDSVPHAIGVSPDGSKVYVTGSSLWNHDFDDATVAYDTATGNSLWAARTNLTGDESALAVAVDPDGASVFVTGSANLATFRTGDYLTVAYPG